MLDERRSENVFHSLHSVNKESFKSQAPIVVANEEKDGFNDTYVLDNIPSRLKCVICGKLMRNPIQTSNGRLACKYCYLNAKGDSNVCPIDGNNDTEIFPDRATGLEILKLKTSCQNREHGCTWQGTIRDSEKHSASCNLQPSKCIYCKENTKDLHEHLKECTYLNELTSCPYKGCNFKPSHSSDMFTHIQDYTFIHILLFEPELQKMQDNNENLQTELFDVKQDLEKNKLESEQQIQGLMKAVSKLTIQMNQMQSTVEELNEQIVSQNCKRPYESKTIETTDETETANLLKSVSLLGKNLEDLDLRQQLLENTTYNGKIMWKIDKYKLRKQQAITGHVTALHSAPCFTDRYGYKFCGRLYLNGDGVGKCKYLSLFFVLMKSEYDNVSKWPFKHRVTFRLTNQEGTSNIKKESFLPDENSSSFQKPLKNMNIAAGCPTFISIDELETGGFIKDDSFFIEINVTK